MEIAKDSLERLEKEKNIWLATVRPSGRPHLVPVWFVFDTGYFYICIHSESVKGKNLRANPLASLSLEDGAKALICEGKAEILPQPWPQEIVEKFKGKYNWDIVEDKEYDQLNRIQPEKWLKW